METEDNISSPIQGAFKLGYKDFKSIAEIEYLKKPSIIVMRFFGLFFILFSIYLLVVQKLTSLIEFGLLACGIFITFFPLVVVTYRTKRNFFSNRMLQEKMNFKIDEDAIVITGESFASEIKWAKVYAVLELKDWLLIYQSKYVYNVIPKYALENHLIPLKDIIKSHKTIRQKLL